VAALTTRLSITWLNSPGRHGTEGNSRSKSRTKSATYLHSLRATVEIVRVLFDKLDPRFLPIDIVIRETGASRGEVLDLQHWQVDREERVIRFPRTKNGKTTVAPLTQGALDAIDSVPPLTGCDYVFYNPEMGTRWYDARRPCEDARESAGYPWLRVRDLRPAFAIEASGEGAPMHFIQSALGHGEATAARHRRRQKQENYWY
jgi:integrase